MPIAARTFRTYVEENLDALSADPARAALVHQGRRVTAGEFRSLVHRLARALRARGVDRGATVTLLSGNLPEAVAARYAANLIGARVNHLYNKLSAESQAAIVRDVETRALIVDPRYAERAAEVTELAPVPDVLVLGPAKLGADLLELAAGQSDEPFASRARPDDVCTIRHTGGTTGHPKGICTTFEQARWFHGVLLLPPLLYQLMDHPDAPHTDTSSLRMLTYGGCQASPARIADAVRAFGPVLMQGYGQNEAGGISVLTQEDHDPQRPDRLRSAGKVLPDVEVAIRDEAGRDLPTGEHGEVCVRSAMIMKGYWKQPELTAEVLRDGWLHTGDIGFLDDEGYLTIVDRLKDMIVVVGGHVYTTELEDLLNSHPQVLQSAVFGVRDADRMERVHAAVVRAPGSDVDGQQLRAMVCAERGAMYEPHRVTFVEALPLTDAGKPDKKELRRRADQEAGTLA
ncbi:Acyl-CoA synthetase (AMP-forming)/AMP-acid ligase II [Streptomyces sp. SceaMP-e96]|uniref:AMP-binding protein n=1 Tax=Streptomyces TaxID=1883 RepID=UPI0008238521|nr:MULTISPECIES: AMP-binding protein [unclassified Streptomyces]MYT10887.1 AMP-binding protein [Streptomyces sp. SID4951]SCK05073.1 Acyl-CoA synthetase (AMP-forming)/AMP-acid ligase II [Streptomyces sp. SceaMP-e96]